MPREAAIIVREKDGTFSEVPLRERFFQHIEKRASGCWVWTGAKCGNKTHAYGQSSLDSGTKIPAHRVSWILHRGAIPEGMQICHKCDNPSCVNPEHLFLGTQKDNIRDAARKGHMRGPGTRGETHSRAILTEADVIEIRRRWDKPDHPRVADLAREYGVAHTTMRYVVHRVNWKHVA